MNQQDAEQEITRLKAQVARLSKWVELIAKETGVEAPPTGFSNPTDPEDMRIEQL